MPEMGCVSRCESCCWVGPDHGDSWVEPWLESAEDAPLRDAGAVWEQKDNAKDVAVP